jgi:hypothetical protein
LVLRARWLAIAIVAVIVGDVVGLSTIDKYPSHWDARVGAIAQFVEDERGLQFDHPVKVEFLSEAAYKKQAAGDEPADDSLDDVLRAVGLIPKNANLGDASSELASEGTTAYYDSSTKKITVRGEALDVEGRATIAHELTHVLQDQNFDIDRAFDTDGASTAFQALVEGDADHVEYAYVDSLPESEQDEYYGGGEVGADGPDLGGVPPALVQLFDAPYRLGDVLVDYIIQARGRRGLNEVLRKPPRSEEAMFDPSAIDEALKPVDKPRLKPGEKELDRADFGVVTWFVMLAAHVDDRVALKAIDGWGNDAYVAFTRGDSTCARVRFVGDSATDAEEMAAALTEWKKPFPAGSAAVAQAGDVVDFESCYAGGDVPAPSAGLDHALSVPEARIAFATELLDAKLTEDLAWCAAGKVVASYTTAQLEADELPAGAPDPMRVGFAAGQSCAAARSSTESAMSRV